MSEPNTSQGLNPPRLEQYLLASCFSSQQIWAGNRHCLMKLLSLFTLCVTLTIPSQGALIITGVFDGPLPGGDPKGVELFATANIPDLSNFASRTMAAEPIM